MTADWGWHALILGQLDQGTIAVDFGKPKFNDIAIVGVPSPNEQYLGTSISLYVCPSAVNLPSQRPSAPCSPTAKNWAYSTYRGCSGAFDTNNSSQNPNAPKTPNGMLYLNKWRSSWRMSKMGLQIRSSSASRCLVTGLMDTAVGFGCGTIPFIPMSGIPIGDQMFCLPGRVPANQCRWRRGRWRERRRRSGPPAAAHWSQRAHAISELRQQPLGSQLLCLGGWISEGRF